ncbi:MAG: urease subunit gamma [Nitrosopumilus sp.]|uniref:urease subunit gamma n=1 Tax=Nitrosopumilus sp. TaxID=2024843 RepID=UPI00292CEC05|nr:urease subunit gamma [Nitrosopumilus sp.]
MNILVLVQGDPDTKPSMKTFDYKKSDEFIFYESVQQIKKQLLNNRQLNFDEAIGLFVAYIATSLDEGKTVHEIKKYLPKLLQSNQVLIGVPESLQKITFTITVGDLCNETMSVLTPIPITNYFFRNNKQIIESEALD